MNSTLSGKEGRRSYSTASSPGIYDLRSTLSPQSPFQQPLSSVPEDSCTDITDSPSSPQMILSSSDPTSATWSKHRSWHRRPSTPYTPREARGEYESTRELAKFIRTASNSKGKKLIPKDARGEYESVEELAMFVQLYAPGESSETEPQPLHLDPDLVAEPRMAQLLRDDDVAILSPASASSYGKDIASLAYPSPERMPSPIHRYSAPTSLHAQLFHEVGESQSESSIEFDLEKQSRRTSDPCSPAPIPLGSETILQLLQPAVYKPPNVQKRMEQSDSDRTSESPRQKGDIETPPTSASSTTTCYRALPISARRDMARNDALMKLEGRQRTASSPKNPLSNKLLPPDPGGGRSRNSLRFTGTPESVATEDFFDKVLGPRKKRSPW